MSSEPIGILYCFIESGMGCGCSYLCSHLRSCCEVTARFLVSPEESIRRKRRLVLGVVVLLLVDFLWVGSSELTDFIFHTEGFDKPFFTTYFKTSAFMLYLTGFMFYEPWRQQCLLCLTKQTSDVEVSGHTDVDCSHGRENASLLHTPSSSRTVSPLPGPLIEEPVFEEITDDEISRNQSQESDSEMAQHCNRQVTFSSVREVRQLSTQFREQARIARCSYHVSENLAADALLASQKLPLTGVACVALIFCFLWFCANCSYQEAIARTSPAAVNILSSSSGLFTLVLASIFQSSAADKFTVSKLFAVIMSIAGITLVTLSDSKSGKGGISIGAIWALAGAFLYSCYLIMLKHKIPDEGKMDIPMFFGLVGAFNFVLLWPGFFILHYSGIETFELPKDMAVWGYIILNAIIGTVISEFLWLWGCYLTSSLTATLSLSLLIPLTMLFDIFVKRVHFSWTFFVGSIPSFASFFAVSLLSHYGDWDPVWVGFKTLVYWCRGLRHQDSSGLDGEQNEGLLSNDREEETNDNVTI